MNQNLLATAIMRYELIIGDGESCNDWKGIFRKSNSWMILLRKTKEVGDDDTKSSKICAIYLENFL